MMDHSVLVVMVGVPVFMVLMLGLIFISGSKKIADETAKLSLLGFETVQLPDPIVLAAFAKLENVPERRLHLMFVKKERQGDIYIFERSHVGAQGDNEIRLGFISSLLDLPSFDIISLRGSLNAAESIAPWMSQMMNRVIAERKGFQRIKISAHPDFDDSHVVSTDEPYQAQKFLTADRIKRLQKIRPRLDLRAQGSCFSSYYSSNRLDMSSEMQKEWPFILSVFDVLSGR